MGHRVIQIERSSDHVLSVLREQTTDNVRKTSYLVVGVRADSEPYDATRVLSRHDGDNKFHTSRLTEQLDAEGHGISLRRQFLPFDM